MNQSFIDALMHFYSLLLLPLPGKRLENIRTSLEDYITRAGISFPVEECLKIFNTYSGKYFFELSSNAYRKEEDVHKIQRHLIIEAGFKSQENLYLQERILCILSLLEFNKLKNHNDKSFLTSVSELSKSLNISESDYSECLNFIHGNPVTSQNKDLVLEETDFSEELEGEWVNENIPTVKAEKRKKLMEKVRSNIRFHLFDSYHFIAFIYHGDHSLFINEKRTYPGYFYSYRRKDILQFEGMEAIGFDEIEEHFENRSFHHKVVLCGEDLSYRHTGTNYSIKPFSFLEESGQLVGIIGNNGVGKSTILQLISNQLKPANGKLSINGSDMIVNSYRLKSVTGYVSQESIEFPGLTVYENLLYQAHLTVGNMKVEEIRKRVDQTLEKLSLSTIKHVRAGTTVDHKINDFQRICLRIAIEMIREPFILFLDEPLSGLSFSDSKRLLSILKEETLKGKLVILTSQLPTSEIYNMFDKVWLIDTDGYMIFNGPPPASLSFFRNTGLLPYYYIQTRSDLVSAEDVLKIVETKKILTDGSISEERQVAPGTWYDAWRAESRKEQEFADFRVKPLPVLTSALPGIEKQFMVYLYRNFRLRWSTLRFYIYNFLGVPVAGALMAMVTRFTVHEEYLFSENLYVPLFLFLSVNLILLTSMFSGMEEIFNEQKQIKRDLSLNLSNFSYQNSKVFHVLTVSFIQALLFSIFTNSILEIKNQLFTFSFIYFSVAAFGNFLSLSLASSIRKLNSIFILIPFLVVPNLLFSGYLIPFNQAGMGRNQEQPVPVIAEFSPTRWAYEALVTENFGHNPYFKNFFSLEKSLYQSKFLVNHLLPVLMENLNKCQEYKYIEPDADSLFSRLSILKNELSLISENENFAPFEYLNRLSPDIFDSVAYQETFGYLTYLQFVTEELIHDHESSLQEKTAILADSLWDESIFQFRAKHDNKAVRQLASRNDHGEKVYIARGNLIKLGSPAYLTSSSVYGRSHFYASEKRFNNQNLSTYRYNMTFLWVMNLFLYILFLPNGLNAILDLFRE